MTDTTGRLFAPDETLPEPWATIARTLNDSRALLDDADPATLEAIANTATRIGNQATLHRAECLELAARLHDEDAA